MSMARLRADGAFVLVSTVGAPPQGGSLPRCNARKRASFTPCVYSIKLCKICQPLKTEFSHIPNIVGALFSTLRQYPHTL